MGAALNFYSYILCLIFIGNFTLSCAFAKASTVGVVYPKLREPYRSVFRNIVRGIRTDKTYKTVEYKLTKDQQVSEVLDWLKKKKIKVVVALGSRGLEVAREFPDAIKIVFGAVMFPPEPFPHAAKGITLTPHPELLFAHLKKLTSHVSRIQVVYNPDNFEWLIALAMEAAADADLKLSAFPASNFSDAASKYRDIFDQYESRSDAVWLLQDPSIIDERAILQLTLEQAWQKKIVVFSSNPSHVRKGILFSLYPDNVGMGRSLAKIVRSIVEKKNDAPSIAPVKDLLIAVNLRTAEHLGLKITRSQKKKFSTIFPSR